MKQYPKYKESGIQWIGQVPEHWEVSKLKYFVECRMGETILATETTKKGIPIYSATQDDSIFGYIENPKLTLRCGDLVIPARGNSIGCVSMVKEEVATCTQTTICVRNIHNLINRFLFYCCVGLKKYWYRYEGGAIPQITVDQVLNNVLVLPPLSEQEAIAAYLDKQTGKIDKSIESLAQQKTDLQQYRTSLISEAVTRGLNPNTTLKDSGVQWIGQIPEEWEVSKLKYVLRVNGRVGFKGYTTADLVSEGEGAYTIGGKHITNCVLDLSNADYISWDKYYESPEIMVKTGDIVMAQRGTLGKAALIKEDIGPATINPSLVLLNEISINNVFLLYYLLSKPIQEWIGLMNTATAVPMISQNQIDNMPIPVPSLPEQEAIAAYLDERMGKIDTAIATIDRQIADLRAYRTALITEAVTGKVDVRVSV